MVLQTIWVRTDKREIKMQTTENNDNSEWSWVEKKNEWNYF